MAFQELVVATTNLTRGQVYGASLGFVLGGPAGAGIGFSVGGAIDPPPGPNLSGPRLSDLSVQSSSYGQSIPRIYGTFATHGNVIWLENNRLREVVKKKKQGGKGGGGGTTLTTYTYFATFAVGLCRGPISGVRKIWIGPKLVYDVDQPGSVQLANFKVYLGTDTQQPDPRIQADRGVANTPAYRGLAYIVFYDYPLADHGNSLLGAQVKVEVVGDGGASFTSQRIDLINHSTFPASSGTVYNPLRHEIWSTGHDPNGLTRFHADTGAYLGFIATPGFTEGSIHYNPAIKQVICDPSSFSGLYAIDAWSAKYLRTIPYTFTNSAGFFQRFIIDERGDDEAIYFIDPDTGLTTFQAGGVWVANGSVTPTGTTGVLQRLDPTTGAVQESVYLGTCPTAMVADSRGRVWMIRRGVTTHRLTVYDPSTKALDEYENDRLDDNWSLTYDSDRDSIWFKTARLSPYRPDQMTEFDIATRTFRTPVTLPRSWNALAQGQTVTYDAGRHILWIAAADSNLMGLNPANGLVEYDLPIFSAYPEIPWEIVDIDLAGGWIWVANGSDSLLKVNPATLVGNAVTLDQIVSAESLQSRILSGADIDVTALASQVVRGYRVAATGAIRAAIDPLRGAWPFDVIQSGYRVKFVPRGTPPIASVTEGELDARSGDDGAGLRFGLDREMDTQLPRRLTLMYVDPSREYDIGEQSAERLHTQSDNVREVEMSIVLTADEGAQIAERLLYLQWLERVQSERFRLPPTYLALEPGDVITVTTSDASHRLHLQSVHYLNDGRLECQARLDQPAVYSPAAQGEDGDSTGATLTLEGLTRAAYLDIPAIRESEDRPGFVAAVTGYLDGWSGGVVFESPDRGQTWNEIDATAAPGANIGIALTSIGAGRTDIIDTVSVLQVEMSQDLESVTQLQLFGGSNLFAYGSDGRWEIIGAQTCTLQGDGSWILTNLLRGRFGTESAMTQHAVGDTVVALTANTLTFVPSETSAIGLSRLYLAITAGGTLDSDYATEFTYRGVNLECLSPVYLNGNRDPSTQDWTLTWMRRTRVGGAWRDYVDAMLGETAESYEIDIFADGTYATVKRTLTSTSASVSYSSANQVTDFGSNQSTLYVRIYQMSTIVGRGYPLQTSITR